MRLSIFLLIAVMLMPMKVLAEAGVLTIDSTVDRKASDKYISMVHKEIFVKGYNVEQIRYAILQGMLTTRGYRWGYEGEGEDFILARFDYKGNSLIMRVEFTGEHIQLKYHWGTDGLVCKENIEGVCYRNHRNYYKYVRHLRDSIAQEVQFIGAAK